MNLTNVMLNIFLMIVYAALIVPIGLLYQLLNVFDSKNSQSFYVVENHLHSKSMRNKY